MKNNQKKMTRAERAAMEAEVAALRLKAKKLNAALKADDEAAEDVTEPHIEEVAAEVAQEVPVEETPVEAEAEEVTAEETPVEAEAEEVTAEEAPVEAEAEEVPAEEAPVEAEAGEESDEEAPVEAEAEEESDEEAPVEAEAEEVTAEETPVEAEAEEESDEEAPVEAEAEEESDEEAPVEAEAEEESDEDETDEAEAEEESDEEVPVVVVPADAKRNWTPFWLGAIAILLATIVTLMIAMMAGSNNQPPVTDPDGNTPPAGDVTPGPGEVAFDMDAFATSVANIASTLTKDEDITANVDVFVEKIGEDKLVELVGKYGELPVQKAIAEFLAFVPEVKMNQYISNNGLAYNPNAVDEYYLVLLEADNAYMEATGKNPNGALMSLEGYDVHKSNREAMKALIAESGDTALLTWYEAKTEGYDLMEQQKADTEAALAYKEEVKLELVNNVNGAVKLLELQLEQKINGTDSNTLKYTDVYAEFILNNYMYVVAN